MNYIGAIAIVLYGTTSLAQTIFNKKVLATYPFDDVITRCHVIIIIYDVITPSSKLELTKSRYEFEASNLLMLLQMVMSSLSLFIAKQLGIFTFPPFNMETANKVDFTIYLFFFSLSYILYLYLLLCIYLHPLSTFALFRLLSLYSPRPLVAMCGVSPTQMLPLSLSYFANVLLALVSLPSLSLAMYRYEKQYALVENN